MGERIPPIDPPGDRDPLLLLRPLKAAVAAARRSKLSGRIPVETLSIDAVAAAEAVAARFDLSSLDGGDRTSKEDDDEEEKVSTPSVPLPSPPSSRRREAEEDVNDSKVEPCVVEPSRAFVEGVVVLFSSR